MRRGIEPPQSPKGGSCLVFGRCACLGLFVWGLGFGVWGLGFGNIQPIQLIKLIKLYPTYPAHPAYPAYPASSIQYLKNQSLPCEPCVKHFVSLLRSFIS